MASSYDKVVKLACKPKAAPPKAKYMDPIIAATWSEDGAVHDVCRALIPRFREPNAIVVFKALIVLHTMIRNGATDNVLGYLSSSEILRLRNVSAGHWEGYNAPQNLQNYAIYLDSRIRAYRDLKHDAIRVQSESNRDMRNSQAIQEDRMEQMQHEKKSTRRRFGRKEQHDDIPSSSTVQRSKTMAGRKLRVMTVEKGLLRETKVVQKMVDSLVECRLYLDDLSDELNVTALRMLVKDLLILFQACNEGVINVLEHYFEMSKIDAQEALTIYRNFCKQTEKVVEYLGVAKKLQNLLNVPIPNLRHAPVSLAGSLEEYLNDPNFEQNRIEYKTNKEIADKNAKAGIKATTSKPAEKAPEPKATSSSATASGSTSAAPAAAKQPSSQAMIDFFSSIEQEQQSMFNPQTNSPNTAYFQQQATYNPFALQQQPMMTGAPFGQPQVPLQLQPTGFVQQSPTNPFGMQQQQVQQFNAFLQPQATGFLQPQATGAANPFRQSTLFPQATGMQAFAIPPQQQPSTNPFPTSASSPFPIQAQSSNPFPPQSSSTNPFPTAQSQSTNPFPAFQQQSTSQPPNLFSSIPANGPSNSPFGTAPTFSNVQSSQVPIAQPTASTPSTFSTPARPQSAPHKPFGSTSDIQPVKTHQTGSRNPFGVPVEAPPPVPKIPTLMELAMGMQSSNISSPSQTQTQVQPTLTSNPTGFGSFSLGGLNGTNQTGSNPSSGTGATSGSIMSSIASSFTSPNDKGPTRSATMPLSSSPTGATATSTATGSTAFTPSLFSSISPQATSTTSTSFSQPSINVSSPLQPQQTGFSGMKAFKPSSSFGAALLESLPPIPQSAPTTPGPTISTPTGSQTAPASTMLLGSGAQTSNISGMPGSVTGLTTGVGLRPQATGLAGAANPFRASMFPASSGLSGGAFGTNTPSFTTSPSAPSLGNLSGGIGSQPTGMQNSYFGANSSVGGGANLFGLGMGSGAQDANKGQQQHAMNGQSLI
ncbi:ANTH domain-containing protein [Abortiporus biennis]|nr:ANTH domain-containing protein [Abortiporus biennis]